MFLDVTRRRNPLLIEAAVDLHRAGRIPSNCYVIDIDTVAANARTVSTAANAHGLVSYQMTKQFGRNPLVAQAVARNGIERVVAVEFEEARLLHSRGLLIGHLGHLTQVPVGEMRLALEMQPQFITVFGLEQAEQLSRAAVELGVEQSVLLRVHRDGDTYYAAQRGGVPTERIVEVASHVQDLPGIEVAGVTSFPCVLFNEGTGAFELTSNVATMSDALGRLRDAGLDVSVLNAPSASSSATVGMLADAGATHVEPGSCLTGQTPLHAVSDEPEVPAMIYVSEVTHDLGDTVFTLGGGFYPRSRAAKALIFGRGSHHPVEARVELDPPEAIDYYGNLRVDASDRRAVHVGDTVVYAFRAQVFVSRCFVAVIEGADSTPSVVGVFDRGGFELGGDLLPAAVGSRS
ncbi:alanine racemase [Nocardioides sp.]|uniref:alanine racemase n=1 Tax=Nocardioides sp. TaxID=35761 RepID=UPI002625B85E|nr:alanine racemase [Nocardioides sp.]MCW2736853.1 hypothetical protein [Nocardioides sp.]